MKHLQAKISLANGQLLQPERRRSGSLERLQSQGGHSLYHHSCQKYSMMSCRFQLWTAAEETGSCVHLTNAQPHKKKKGERGKEGKEESDVLLKIFNPPSIN